MSEQKPRRNGARTYTVLGLLGLFIVAVVAVLLRQLFPGRISGAAERIVRRRK